MAITASMVKELREMTGAGMMDCKKALNETNGDMDAAVEFLRKNGEAKAVKKAARIAAEGLVMCGVADGKAAIVEVNSETDFVAKNEEFQGFVKAVVNQAMASESANMEEFMAEAWNEDTAITVNDALIAKIARIGEKLSIRRFEKIVSDGVVVSYIHGGGRIGVLVEADAPATDDVKEAMKNIAMQVAALKPEYISRDDVSAEHIAHEKEVIISQSLNDPASLPKPILNGLLDKVANEKLWGEADLAILAEKRNDKYLFNFLSDEAKAKLAELAVADKDNIAENKIFKGMIEGRISKQLKEACLMDQTYVKAEDGKQTVGKYIAEVAKAAGANVAIKKLIRFETGEGIEKKQEDFAAEVAAQMAGK